MDPSMRPKVNGDTFFLPDPDGIVYFRNNNGSFRMEGPMIDRWIEQLIPMFNGEFTLADMTGGLPEAHQNRVVEIAASLHENGFVRDAGQDRPHGLTKQLQEKFAPQIDFLDAFGGSGAARFERYRQTRVLAAGQGSMLVSLVACLLESGLARFRVLAAGCGESQRRRIGELATYARLTDPEVRVETVFVDDAEAVDWENAAAGFYAVVYASSEKGNLDTIRRLDRVCRAGRIMFIPAAVVHQTGLAGPVSRPGSDVSWASAWRRLHQTALERDPALHETSSPAEAMLANYAVFELFRHATGAAPANERGECYLLNLETLEASRHPFLPHPAVTESGQAPWRTAELSPMLADTPASREAGGLLPYFAGLHSPVNGILHEWDEGNLKQLPLSLCRVQAADPRSDGPAGLLTAVLSGGFTHEEARREAGLAGIESYVSRWYEGREFTGIGAGETAAEGVCRALVHSLRERIGERKRRLAPADISAWTGDLGDERCRFYFTSLTIMGEQPEIAEGRDVCGFPVRWVRWGEYWYGAAGLTPVSALRAALAEAAMDAQCGTDPDAAGVSGMQAARDADTAAGDLALAVRVLAEQRISLTVWDLASEPFLKEGIAGVYGIVLREEETA